LTAAAVSLLLLAGCAGTAGADGTPVAADPSGSAPATADGALALQVRSTGGFVTPSTYVTRLPLVSVYDDGRVITEGPQIAIYPGPALPAVQVQAIPPAYVKTIVDKAVAAGVRSGADLGRPPIADATSTRFTLRTADGGEQTLEVYALTEYTPGQPGVTAAQQAARDRLKTLLDQVTDVQTLVAAAELAKPQPYVPTALAAVVRPYVVQPDPATSAQPAVAWPGPALPGTSVGAATGISCVTVTGDAVATVLGAAKNANAMTPWTAQGKQWSIELRPLLPEEADCAALTRAAS
jgi:hypothetical protein